MDDEIRMLAGRSVLVCAEDGPVIASEADALDLMGRLWGLEGQEVEWIAVPVARLSEAFLDLKTGLLGAVVQKFVNYRLRLAVVGDVTAQIAASKALRDYVHEANLGAHVRFAPDLAELELSLADKRRS